MKRTMVIGSKHHRGMVQPLLALARAAERSTRQNAMGALMPMVANSNHEYGTAFAKLSGEDRSTHLPAVHELCKRGGNFIEDG